MAFRRFRNKIDDELGPADILLHSVDYLDEVTLMALKEKNFETLGSLYDKYLDASDRLMGLAAMGYEEEKQPSEQQQFGFTPTNKTNSVTPPDGESG